ncbi:MAG: hypothetical protein GX604_02730 [Actinobacteria bacterium]|nr:hypothetical protein [Actinomycetota bacterium]
MATTMWMIGSDALGVDSGLGKVLMQAFFNSIGERLTESAIFWFYNRGTLLTQPDSPVLEAIKALEMNGNKVATCGTCLSYYNIKDTLAVGEIGNMPLMQELIISSEKVVSL